MIKWLKRTKEIRRLREDIVDYRKEIQMLQRMVSEKDRKLRELIDNNERIANAGNY